MNQFDVDNKTEKQLAQFYIDAFYFAAKIYCDASIFDMFMELNFGRGLYKKKPDQTKDENFLFNCCKKNIQID